ncbi:MAG: PLD nuclease N-terminal domain-containing protein [Bacillus sp. (in: firmicutes)]
MEIETSKLMLILLPILVLQLILMVTALVSLIKQEETQGPKWLWAIIIILFNIVGPILYFIIGRKQR